MRKYLIAAVAALALSACVKQAQTTEQTTNNEFQVETLFRYDGCTVYRFYDSRSVHWVKCDGKTTVSTSEHVDCGKGCMREVTTRTE